MVNTGLIIFIGRLFLCSVPHLPLTLLFLSWLALIGRWVQSEPPVDFWTSWCFCVPFVLGGRNREGPGREGSSCAISVCGCECSDFSQCLFIWHTHAEIQTQHHQVLIGQGAGAREAATACLRSPIGGLDFSFWWRYTNLDGICLNCVKIIQDIWGFAIPAWFLCWGWLHTGLL